MRQDRDVDDDELMRLAIDAAASVRTATAPNPWVGAVLLTTDGKHFVGATAPPGGAHAEVDAIRSAHAAGADPTGATMATTLEPCAHHGRTGPCADAVIDAGITRVVVGIEDPDAQVAGAGVRRLREAGVDVRTGVEADVITDQLAAYLHHRRTGRPYVVLKLAATVDGATAAADGSSRWITGEAARRDAHRLRAESQAILVGAGTVRADDPSLTTRLVDGPDPRRIVLGTAPPDARVHPCLEWDGTLDHLLERLGDDGVLQLMVEGGATVAHTFHTAGLVDRYVVYVAPALVGGDDAHPLFTGPAAATIADVWRGRFAAVAPLEDDVRLDIVRVR